MIPRVRLDSTTVPGQEGELQLYQHDKDFYFHVRGCELMSSRTHGSEEVLAEVALAKLESTKAVRVLVGGLGMGFTLAKALEIVGAESEVVVCELVPKIVEWNRTWFGALNGHPIDDARTALVEGDVVPHIRKSRGGYHCILLDVDNGPEALTRDSNATLYTPHGLKAARAALKPGGVLAIWSSSRHPWFTDRLQSAGFEVREERVRARQTKGARRTIWVAQRNKR